MRVSKAVFAIALAGFVGALAIHLNRRNVFSLAPSPVKKWEFTTTKSRVKDCSLHPCSPADDLPDHAPAIDTDGTIYVGGQNELYALNPDGTVKWSHGYPSQVAYAPILYIFIDDGANVWFNFNSTAGTSGLFRVDREGNEDAVLGGTAPVYQAGISSDGTIIVVRQTGVTVMKPNGQLEPSVGTSWGAGVDSNVISHVPIGELTPRELVVIKWEQSRANFAFAPDRRSYHLVGMGDIFLVPILTDWTVPWTAAPWTAHVGTKGGCVPPALGSDGMVYVSCIGQVTAVNPDGTQKWLFPIPGYRAGQPAIDADGNLYFGCEDSNLYALTPEGNLKWKFATGDLVLSTPALAKNGTIFFGSRDHNLYAVDAKGKLRWRFSTGGQVFSPTIAPDGNIYALSADGKLYAIQDLEENGGLWGQWPKWAGDLRNTWREPTHKLSMRREPCSTLPLLRGIDLGNLAA